MNAPVTRRKVLQGSGALALAFAIPLEADAQAPKGGAKPPRLPGNLNNNRRVSGWLRIEPNGKVRLLVGKVEIGQGILTAVTQLCADQLQVDISRIVLTSGDTALVPFEGTTAGSLSMPGCGTAVRQVAAEARELLLKLAESKLGVSAAELRIDDGTIIAPNGKTITYWELAAANPLNAEATGKAPLKPRAENKYAGKHVPRIDIPAKMTGRQIFLHDLRLPGMVHGRAVRPPAYNARLISADVATVEKMPGVQKVLRDGNFLGVVASREEQAIFAAEALRKLAQWDIPKSGPTSETIFDWLQQQKTKDIVVRNDARTSATKPAKTIEATFKRPYHMHASIGPSCAIATYAPGGEVTIQTHSQSVFETGEAIAKMLGLDKSNVRCQHHQGSGCYGHNGADDAAADAALLARAVPGKPVRVQWMRHDEHKWEPYGSAMLTKLKANVDEKGGILDWDYEIWSTSHGTRPGRQPGNLLAGRMLEKPFPMPVPRNGGPPSYAADRNGIALYDVPGQKVTTHFIETFAARVSATRGLGAYANVVSIESFMDELARNANADPVEYRLRYLRDERARAVLLKTADMFGWPSWQARPGRGRGIAFARYKNLATYTAVAIEAEVDRASRRIRVLRAVSANDAGEIVAPDGVKNQIEGGIVQSLSWSLKEAVRFGPGGVRSEDWTSYPILTFSEMPRIEIEMIDRPGAPFLGAGEASQGPTGAALSNALRDATGVRFSEAPFTPARIREGLKT